jgi:hypothetical protein
MVVIRITGKRKPRKSRVYTLRLRDSYSDEAGLLGTKHWLGLYHSLLTDA